MKTFTKMLLIDFKRTQLRNFAALFFSLLMPIAFYLLFTKVMNQDVPAKYLISFQKQYMISMVTYSIVISMLFSFASLLARDNLIGIPKWLRITSLPNRYYYLSKLTNVILQNLLSIMLVYLVAATVNHVHFSGQEFALMLIWLLLASLPLSLIGIMISMINNENTRSVFSNLLTFPLVIVSGLWWPLDQMPKFMQHIGYLSPVYAVNAAGQALANGEVFQWSWLWTILIWFVILLIVLMCLNKLRNRLSQSVS